MHCIRVVWLLLVLCPHFLFAFGDQSLSDGLDATGPDIVWQWSLYRDASDAEDVFSVRRLPEMEWREYGRQNLNLGYAQDAVWLRIRIGSRLSRAVHGFLELKSTRIESIDWYVMDGPNLLETMRNGSLVAERENVPDMRRPGIILLLPPGAEREVFVRIKSDTAIQIALSVSRAGAAIGNVAKSESVTSLLLGLMLGLLVLVFLFSWAFRDPRNVYYALGTLLLGLVLPVMGGYPIWLRLPGVQFWTHHAVILMVDASMLFLLYHCSCFLRLRETMPGLARGLRVYMLVVIVVTAVALMWPFYKGIHLVIGVILASSALMMGVAVTGVSRRYRDALFYLLGNGVLWIYLWVQMFFYYGLIRFRVLPETFGLCCINLALLSFIITMVQRVRLLQREKETAQVQAIAWQKKLADELELLVTARTKELSRAKEQAEDANQAKTRFFSRISHDLRAPLNWLVGLVDSLWLESREQNLSDEFKVYLQYIRRGSYYLTQLLNNIMDIGAVEAGATDRICAEKMNIGEWSSCIEATAQALAKSSEVTLRWTMNDREALCAFCSDPAKLSQILMNLVHNAIKFTPPGKTVGVTLGAEAGALSLVVEDEGEGLPAREPEIFESYCRGDAGKKEVFDGVGLGLFIVKSNLSVLRGSIHARNRECGGAVFRVLVPPCE